MIGFGVSVVRMPCGGSHAPPSLCHTGDEIITHLKPQVLRHVVWTHVRRNIYTGDLLMRIMVRIVLNTGRQDLLPRSLDDAPQPPSPRMPLHGHNPALFAAVEWVGILGGRRKFSERPVVDHQGVVLLPVPIVSG